MLTLIITNGFEKVIHEKMQGINSQIIISSPRNKLAYQAIRTVLLKEFKNEIKAVSARTENQALIDHNQSQSVIFLEGIDGKNEALVTTLPEKIIRPKMQKDKAIELVSNLPQDHVLIGYKTAEFYQLHVGDAVNLMIPEPASKHKVFFNEHKFVVGGIFKIGLDDYDSNIAFCQIDKLNKLFEQSGVDQITIKLLPHEKRYLNHSIFCLKFWTGFWSEIKFKAASFFTGKTEEDTVIEKLKKRLPHLQINSWKDLNPALVSSLKLEKYAGFFILALIMLVACMNMISLLFMQIQQKRRDIAIFKAMGLSDRCIGSIFLHLGISITLAASVTGLALAGLAGYLLEKYPFIELPDVYYVSYLPARMEPEIFFVVFLATMLLGFLATWIPFRRSKQIEIAQVLRQE
jgi:lipoprotein-releasing system permease protein